MCVWVGGCVCVCMCVCAGSEDFHEVLVEAIETISMVEAGNNSSLVVGDPERNLGRIPSVHEDHTMDKL